MYFHFVLGMQLLTYSYGPRSWRQSYKNHSLLPVKDLPRPHAATSLCMIVPLRRRFLMFPSTTPPSTKQSVVVPEVFRCYFYCYSRTKVCWLQLVCFVLCRCNHLQSRLVFLMLLWPMISVVRVFLSTLGIQRAIPHLVFEGPPMQTVMLRKIL